MILASNCYSISSYHHILAHPGPSCIYAHIDMDCYFVQVALLSHPELREVPVAVASSNSFVLHYTFSF